jgi:hypothetical protein
MRPVQKIEHKNQPAHHKTFDEFSRVQDSVAKHGKNFLPESFNMNLYKYPVWKTNQKNKWVNKKGMDIFSGVHAAHVILGNPG